MLLKLTHPSTRLECEFFHQTLCSDDTVLLTDGALHLAYQANPFVAQGRILHSDAQTIGGTLDPSWTIIEDKDWVRLLTTHDKQISW